MLREVEERPSYRIPVSHCQATLVIWPATTFTFHGPNRPIPLLRFFRRIVYWPGGREIRKCPESSVVNELRTPLSFPTVNVVRESGATEPSPTLVGPGRLGLSVIAPSRPVADSGELWAAEKDTVVIRSARIIVGQRYRIA